MLFRPARSSPKNILRLLRLLAKSFDASNRRTRHVEIEIGAA
jgi:hypothetical protein